MSAISLLSMSPASKKERFVGTPVYVGNEPFSRLVFSVADKKLTFEIKDEEMCKKLSECQNMRVEVVGVVEKVKNPNFLQYSTLKVESFKVLGTDGN